MGLDWPHLPLCHHQSRLPLFNVVLCLLFLNKLMTSSWFFQCFASVSSLRGKDAERKPDFVAKQVAEPNKLTFFFLHFHLGSNRFLAGMLLHCHVSLAVSIADDQDDQIPVTLTLSCFSGACCNHFMGCHIHCCRCDTYNCFEFCAYWHSPP